MIIDKYHFFGINLNFSKNIYIYLINPIIANLLDSYLNFLYVVIRFSFYELFIFVFNYFQPESF